VTSEDSLGRGRSPAHGLFPVDRVRGKVDLAHHEIDHAVEDVVLVGHVVVERHRLDTEPLAELAHCERPKARLVDERDGRSEHPFPA
jgi:hypothetical protein